MLPCQRTAEGRNVGSHGKHFAYNFFLSTSAAVGATTLLGGSEWAAAIGILAFIFVLMEIDGRISARSIFLAVSGWRTGKNRASDRPRDLGRLRAPP
jgi:hypothetical protein